VNTPLEATIDGLKRSAEPALKAQQELRGEIERLFKTVLVDPSMAVARARRLLEVIIKDYYISRKSLVPPYPKLKDLFYLIEELSAGNELSRSASALCHAVRLEGNRVLHYRPANPGEPKWAEVDDIGLATTLQKLLEVAEMIGSGGHFVYLSSLAAPFPTLYERLVREWKPDLEGKQEEQFPLFEALDLLFRSIVGAMRPEWWPLVERYANDNTLPDRIATEEEQALRQLRNLGVIQHDGQWLFTPTRSRRIWPTPTGKLFLALSTQRVSADSESVAREVVQRLNQAVTDQAAIDLLEKVRNGRSLAGEGERAVARRLRNLYLVTHETYFLASAEKLRLTDLGYYVLGKCSPD
jgi:hypothetical protein